MKLSLSATNDWSHITKGIKTTSSKIGKRLERLAG
jgi:hypothetical protein